MAMTFMDGWLHWRDPGYNVPSGPIMLFANDSKGAASTTRISIVLCGCQNGGSCVEVNDRVEDIPFDENGHYKQLCECPEFFGGDSCEVELRGCNYSVCPDSNICQPNASEPSGYICTGCSDGYTKVDSKCIGKNRALIKICWPHNPKDHNSLVGVCDASTETPLLMFNFYNKIDAFLCSHFQWSAPILHKKYHVSHVPITY